MNVIRQKSAGCRVVVFERPAAEDQASTYALALLDIRDLDGQVLPRDGLLLYDKTTGWKMLEDVLGHKLK